MSLLVLDAGQSGVRVRCAEHSLTLAGVHNDRASVPQLAERAAQAVSMLAGSGVQSGSIEEVAVGSTGLRAQDCAEELLDQLGAAGLGVRRVWLAHDSVTSCLGALGEDFGVVVAAGTGTIALAVGPAGVQRVDGWGYLLGNGGSAYWIGREGLMAVLRAHDGRGPATALTDRVLAETDDLESLYLELAADPHRVARIAAWSRVVAGLAESVGPAHEDPVCAEICRRAGAELAHTALSGLARVGLGAAGGEMGSEFSAGERRVAALGGVLAGGPVRSAFAEALSRAETPVRLVDARGTGLDGAAMLPGLAEDHPLSQRVRRASR